MKRLIFIILICLTGQASGDIYRREIYPPENRKYFIDLLGSGRGSPEFQQVSIFNNGELRFYDNGNYVGFEAPALSANQIWILPATDGTSGQVWSTNGSGVISWIDPNSDGILDDSILAVDINDVDSPNDEDILTYESGPGGDHEWHTPAELITAGTNIAWSGTTLNVEYDVNNVSADLTSFETYGIHIIDSSGAGITGTLAAGSDTGQSVKFVCKVAGNDIDITVSNHVTSDPEVIRLDTAKEWVELVWDGTDWVEVDGNGQSYP